MDIATLSVVMANHQVRSDASLAIMNQTKNLMEEQGNQLVEMLHHSTNTSVSHPTLGSKVDLKV